MRMDIKPGRIVEYGGEHYLIEDVEVTVVMQRIESMAPKLARAELSNWETPATHCPVFVKLNGALDDPDSPVSRLIPLYKEDEL